MVDTTIGLFDVRRKLERHLAIRPCAHPPRHSEGDSLEIQPGAREFDDANPDKKSLTGNN